jgi:uroporphyrinogen-III synthase
VLVTRPEPGASRTGRRLASDGFSPLLMPLSRIEPLEQSGDVLSQLPDAVVATSANAILHLSAPLAARLAGMPLFAVGEKTGQAARQAGFASVVEGEGDASELAQLVAFRCPKGARLVYLCGRVRLPDFEEAMKDAGIEVHAVETYDTPSVLPDSESIAALVSGRPVDAVMLYSRNAALTFASIADRAELSGLFEDARLLCLSGKIAAALPTTSAVRHRVAAEPNEDAMFALLDRL